MKKLGATNFDLESLLGFARSFEMIFYTDTKQKVIIKL